MPNQVVRFALSERGVVPSVVGMGKIVTQAQVNEKIDKGSNDLSTGFAVPSSQTPYPMGSSMVSYICHDYSGSLYVSDAYTHTIYKIEEGNKLTAIAGLPGTPGDLSNVTVKDMDDDGAYRNKAAFNSPQGICCDRSGNIYVADTGNHCIKMISGGKIYLVAGNTQGFADNADGKLARFDQPWDITMDKSGNFFVADMMNHAIRKIYKGGSVQTIAGNGHAGNAVNVAANKNTASFDQPVGVAVDPSGNIYVLDGVNNYIKKITPNGWIYRFSGSGTSGQSLGSVDLSDHDHPATYSNNCQYEYLTGIDADASGNIYVVDMGLAGTNSRLLRIDGTGRPFPVVDFRNVTEDWYVNDVTCTPSQKLYVTMSNDMWVKDNSSSSSVDSSSSSSSTSESSSSSSSE